MRLAIDGIKKDPHPEEVAQRPSRRTHAAVSCLRRKIYRDSGRGDRVRRETVRAGGAELAVFHLDSAANRGGSLLVWAHGWGQTHTALLPLAEATRRAGPSVLIDFPGFG